MLEPVKTLVLLYDRPILFSASWALSAVGWITAFALLVSNVRLFVDDAFCEEHGKQRVDPPAYLLLACIVWLFILAMIHSWASHLDRDWTSQILALVAAAGVPGFFWVMRGQLDRFSGWFDRLGNLGFKRIAIVILTIAIPSWVSGNAQGLEWSWWILPYVTALFFVTSVALLVFWDFSTILSDPSESEEYPWWLYVIGIYALVCCIGAYVHLWDLSKVVVIMMPLASCFGAWLLHYIARGTD